MAWIELHQAIWTHRKTILIASRLGLKPTYAAAHIIRFWTWALDNVQDGDLSGLPPEVIAFGADWDGDAETFVKAAIYAGWLDETESGLFIHDWEDYAGKLMERREAEKIRSRKRRAAAKDSPANQLETEVRPTVDQQTTVGTVPNSTLPINNNNSNNNAPERTDVISAFEKEFARPFSPVEIEEIQDWENKYPQVLILEALKRAVLGGKLNFKYINSILVEWFKNRIQTVQEIERYEEDFKKRRGKGQAQQPRAPASTQLDERKKKFIRSLYV